jgi:hypothetical protein
MTEININNLLNKKLNLSENVYTESLEEIQRNSVSGLVLRFLHRDTLDSRKLCINIEDEIIALTERNGLSIDQKVTAVSNLTAMQRKFNTSKLDGKAKECTDTIERTIRLILKPAKKPTSQINTQSQRRRASRSSDSYTQVPPFVIPPKQTPVSTPRPNINTPFVATGVSKNEDQRIRNLANVIHLRKANDPLKEEIERFTPSTTEVDNVEIGITARHRGHHKRQLKFFPHENKYYFDALIVDEPVDSKGVKIHPNMCLRKHTRVEAKDVNALWNRLDDAHKNLLKKRIEEINAG